MRKLPLALLALAALPLAASTAHAQGDVGGAAVSDSRPQPMTVGVGIGTTVGAGNVTAPNIGSVRLVLAPNMIIEPSLALNHQAASAEGGGNSKDTHKENNIALGADVRFMLAGRGPVDLNAIGGLGFGWKNEDLEDLMSTSVSTTTLDLHWGLGLSYYFAHVWSLSLDVTNPLFTYGKASRETSAGGTTNTASMTSWMFGINFAPLTRLLLHLYF